MKPLNSPRLFLLGIISVSIIGFEKLSAQTDDSGGFVDKTKLERNVKNEENYQPQSIPDASFYTAQPLPFFKEAKLKSNNDTDVVSYDLKTRETQVYKSPAADSRMSSDKSPKDFQHVLSIRMKN